MEIQNSTLDDISAVVGFSAALRLCAWFGDAGNLYVPAKAEPGQLLVKLIGLSAATHLSAEWGQQHVAVPRLRGYEDDVRRRRVERCIARGFSCRDVAGLERISERRVQQICRELEAMGLMEAKAVQEKTPAKTPEQIWPAKSVRQKAGGKNGGEKAGVKRGGQKHQRPIDCNKKPAGSG